MPRSLQQKLWSLVACSAKLEFRERQTSRLKPFTLVFNYFQLAVRIESLSWKRFSLTVSPVSIALRVLLPLPQIAHKPRILTVNAMSENTSIASLPGLRGKVALVTGSTAGIGLAIARQLVASGCHVMVNGRSTASCEAACNSMLDDMEGQAIPISGDVATAEGVQALVEKVEAARVQRKLPPVSILINNVGVFETKDFMDITDDEWLNYHNVNLTSGIRLCRVYLPGMREQNWGRIIFISSEAGMRTLPHMIPYSVSKAAQIAAARGLAETTKGSGVTVNSVLPGPTWTTGVENYMKGFAESKDLPLDQAIRSYFKEYEPTSLIQRFLKPEEVSAITAFLCSDLASGINGAAQRVEGGIIHHV